MVKLRKGLKIKRRSFRVFTTEVLGGELGGR
jgi:hypothetical protein